jgi:sporulation protein YlmC with PRC-barrel domain
VVNRQGENVGKIHELVIDARKNRVAYAVLSFGGFMGMGNKLFAMPWEAFEFSATENKLILNVDKEKLKAAPGFEKGDKWPDFKDKLWGESIYNYYNYTPPWKS